MLLTTKFLRPAPDPRSIERDRLLRILAPRPAKRLNLVVAPAGFGKTTLVNQWCEQEAQRSDGRSCAWLALDEHDDEPRRFWQYLAGAFAHAGLGGLEECRNLLNNVSVQELEGATTALINALVAEGRPRALVLDDYHLIRDPRIHRQLSFFIDYLPPNLVVFIASRVEPELPVARWRVRQWLDEIHPQLLAFSEKECQRFFEETMALPLSPEEAHRIWQTTEGWVAAMQLAALSGQKDGEAVARNQPPIAVSNRQINDYVLSEILDKQTPEIREFLLDTAGVTRLCASLANAMRERDDSQALLENLTRHNLFLIPLDTRQDWFRYHDLFRDALLQRARQSDPQRLEDLQNRAIDWLLAHDHIQEAIAQIVQHQDWPRLSRVLELHGNNLIHGGFHLPVLDWLETLPVGEIEDNPRLQMLRVWALFFANRVSQIEAQLSHLEDVLDQRVADSHPDADGALGLQSEIALMRSYLARSRSDYDSAQNLTNQVLRDIDHTRIPLKSVTYYGLGLDDYGRGELGAAESALQSAVSHGQREHKPSTVLSSGGLLAWIQFNRGDIELALRTCTEVRDWIDQHYNDPTQPRLISCWQNATLVEIHRERNQPELAESYLTPLLSHVEKGTEPGQHVIIQYVRAHLAFSQGDHQLALAALEDAEAVARQRREDIVFEPPSCAALRARCYLAMGELERARQWLATEQAGEFRNPLNREQTSISAARVHLASGEPEAAIRLLEPMRISTERDQHYRHLIEVQVLYAEALDRRGATREATSQMVTALKRAARAGFLRMFAEESPRVQALILALANPDLPQQWFGRLRTMLAASKPVTPERATTVAPHPGSALVEPLSQREQEVLALINEGLSNKDIARRMDVAATTVKAHIRNLYGKLDVSRRTEALARARQLKLL
ncbi:MAG: LuxR C-terminal-related transcriptional regulator [Marinobacter sp.]|uniref:LuxR C-terminal-related transcriptional regulator n=1 Tax=Marinobacter sp. TaxID=50741 RepID=UPI00299E1FD1|nr:LuxR C-terminal-related transcriptional regulator [Marinobacter sp.]MDX1633154.1 LuxR C-terminal-related transcriptional regulator [Marinobacter sp.]